jgi:type IV pilus assembly protein PilM
MSFFNKTQSYVGFDIGTTSVKAVELKRVKGVSTLVNYGYSEEAADFSKKALDFDIDRVTQVILELRRRCNMTATNAVASMPSFSVFSSVLNLHEAKKEDMESAVLWEAKKVIPLALEEMILDWKVVGGAGDAPVEGKPGGGKKNVKVLLTGAPRSLVKKYISIFQKAQLRLVSLETEMFSLIRALVGDDPALVAVVDLGAVNTDIAIVENGLPMFIRSLEAGGIMITKAVGDSLKVGFRRAEQFKSDLSLGGAADADKQLPKIITDTLSPIINEIKYSLSVYQQENNKRIEKIILSGGGAHLLNIAAYISSVMDMNVIVGDPWARVSYPLDLKSVLAETGPRMAIAVGLALRETL